jgi:hypothetical protein
MSRLDNAWIVPACVITGLNVQNQASLLGIFFKFADKWKTPYYLANAIAAIFNLLACIFALIMIDFQNSPYPLSYPNLPNVWGVDT